MRKKYTLGLILVLLFFNPVFLGLLTAAIPCYLFNDPRRWCGFKSEPPYFVELFTTGALISMAIIVYLVVKIRKSK